MFYTDQPPLRRQSPYIGLVKANLKHEFKLVVRDSKRTLALITPVVR